MSVLLLQLVLVKNLSTLMEYCLRALRECPPTVHDNVLRALGALLYENSSRVEKVGYLEVILLVGIYRWAVSIS